MPEVADRIDDQPETTAFDDVRAAFAEASKDPVADSPTQAPVEAPEHEEVVETKARDPKTGKFAKSEAVVEQPEKKPTEAPKVEAVAPPANWNGAGKVKWEKLPQDIQREIVRDYQTRQETDARMGQLDAILSPRRESLTRMYGSEAAAVHQLFQLSDFAEKHPGEFIKWYAQQRGVNISALVSPAPQAQQQQEPEVQGIPQHPALQELSREVAQMREYLQATQQNEVTAAQNKVQAEVQAFIANPQYPYANDVRVQMGQLFAAGQASTLQEAYDKAVWMSPDVRKRLIDGEKEAERTRAAQSAGVKRNAAASINGAPGTASPIPTNGALNETPHDTVRRVFEEAARGRV